MHLSRNWVLEEPRDSEYKRYKLLAYFKFLETEFKEKRLYPHLDELFELHRDALVFCSNLKQVKESSKEIKGLDFGGIIYEYHKDAEELEDIIELMEFGLDLFAEYCLDGMDLEERMMESIKLSSVGVSPENMDEGYVLFEVSRGWFIYEYRSVMKDWDYKSPGFESGPGSEIQDAMNSYLMDAVGGPFGLRGRKCLLFTPGPCIEGLEGVKFVTNGLVHEWYGNITADEIKEKLNKKKSVPAVWMAETDFPGGLPMSQAFVPVTVKKLEGIVLRAGSGSEFGFGF